MLFHFFQVGVELLGFGDFLLQFFLEVGWFGLGVFPIFLFQISFVLLQGGDGSRVVVLFYGKIAGDLSGVDDGIIQIEDEDLLLAAGDFLDFVADVGVVGGNFPDFVEYFVGVPLNIALEANGAGSVIDEGVFAGGNVAYFESVGFSLFGSVGVVFALEEGDLAGDGRDQVEFFGGVLEIEFSDL